MNKYVFNCDLNWSTDVTLLSSGGNWFHNLGAVAEKALSPYVFNLVLGTARKFWELERRNRGPLVKRKSSDR